MIQTSGRKLIEGRFNFDIQLRDLRNRCGDAEFGYRMQGLFAHVLLRLGWYIIEVKSKGHPDIRARLGDHECLVQTKSAMHRAANSTIAMSPEDIKGVTELGRRTGWFAVLDCAFPVQWVVVNGSRAVALLGKRLPLALLRANSDIRFSSDCSRQFHQILAENGERLTTLTYALLCSRALKGDVV